jgi:HAD superfamily hydrolase (TIGR01509 family)
MIGVYILINGIIFDLDGTLIDSMQVWHNADREFLIENNIVPPKNISNIMKTMTIESAADYFISQFELPHTRQYVIKRIEEIVSYHYMNTIPLKPGVISLLDFLAELNIPCAIATATYKSLAYAILKRHGIADRFSFLLTGEDVSTGKTSPDIYFECAKRLGCKANDVLVAEDSLHCVQTAHNAGFFTVGVYDSAADADWERICKLSDRNIHSIFSIKNIICELNNFSL